MIHMPYWLLKHGDKGASGIGRTVAFFQYCHFFYPTYPHGTGSMNCYVSMLCLQLRDKFYTLICE